MPYDYARVAELARQHGRPDWEVALLDGTLDGMKVPRPTGVDLETLSKTEVRVIADELLTGDPNAVEAAVRFVCAETVNLWHGRGRAMMCRRMKHVELSRGQQGRLVAAILGRLASGDFSEQFRDQLRLAMRLDPEGTTRLAKRSLKSDKAHVRRFAAWVLSHEETLRQAVTINDGGGGTSDVKQA